jgi:hypothetical protein
MTGETLELVERRSDARPRAGTHTVVLDTSWTPAPGYDARVSSIRGPVQAVLERVNVVDSSLDLLDRWAADAGVAGRLTVEGISWWPRIRMAVRWDMHELVLWRHVLELIAPRGRYATIVLPSGRPNLLAAARAMQAQRTGGDGGMWVGTVRSPRTYRDFGRFMRRFGAGARDAVRTNGPMRRLARRVLALRRRNPARGAAVVDRIAALAGRDAILAVAWAGAFQVTEGDGRRRLGDPYVELVVDRLVGEGRAVAIIASDLEGPSGSDASIMASDAMVIPHTAVEARWSEPGDDAISVASVTAEVSQAQGVPLAVEGADLGPAIHQTVSRYASGWLLRQVRWARWAELALRELRPSVLLVDREATRTVWIAAARRVGVPIVAIQHGMIYPNNPEYMQPAEQGRVRPDVTCVFGPYERDLLVGSAGYDPARVVVTGSPRADPEVAPVPASSTERVDVRRELGVRDGDRLLVISVGHNDVMGDLYSVGTVARLLDGPLPGVHVVVKRHPQDRRASPYERLVDGLARAGGYEPVRLTSVKDIDLYRLLRSADAHLGQHSTVLTDAVLTNTPNMIAAGQAYADVLGYVAAGVAVPVRTVDEVRGFINDPAGPDPDDRLRFIEAHAIAGDAAGRIADIVAGRGRPVTMEPA